MTNDEFLMETARRFGTRVLTYEQSHDLRITTEMDMDLGDGRVCIIVIREDTE